MGKWKMVKNNCENSGALASLPTTPTLVPKFGPNWASNRCDIAYIEFQFGKSEMDKYSVIS